MKVAKQTTLRDHTALCGVGIHSGLSVTLTLHPADADTGLRFIRTHVDGWQDREIPADMSAVTATEFATVLGDASGPLVSTAEHVLAALSGLGVDNAVIEIDGPEAPIMDGSAAPFVAAIDAVGLETLDQARRHIRVLKPVRVVRGDAFGEIRPNPRGFRVEAAIEFDHPLIGRQVLAIDENDRAAIYVRDDPSAVVDRPADPGRDHRRHGALAPPGDAHLVACGLIGRANLQRLNGIAGEVEQDAQQLIVIGIDHKNYGHMAVLGDETKAALAKDFG